MDSMTGYADSTEDAYWDALGAQAGEVIANAEDALGPLTDGEKADLILDNMAEVRDSDWAHYLIASYNL